jgi:hypothetical protein
MNGLPDFGTNANGKRRAQMTPFEDIFPLEDTPIPKGKEGWMLFLDEFNSGKEDTLAASYKLLLDRKTGQAKLHPNVVITAAGNLDTDNAIVNQIGTALKSRVVTIEMELNFEEFREDVMLPQNWDARIMAFLSQWPDKLHQFNAETEDHSFDCPRTWENINKLITGKTFKLEKYIEMGVERDRYEMEKKTALYAGTLCPTTAAEFVQFTKVFNDIVSISDILRDPKGCKVPRDHSVVWATICTVMAAVNEKNLDKLAEYVERFDWTFKVVFYRALIIQHKELRTHPAFIHAMVQIDDYINGV